MTQRYDLVIAGGGPSGSAAAWQAAQTGANVIVLDKAVFPRDKPCGDGLTARAVSYLQRMGLADEVAEFHRVNRVTVFSPSRWELTFPKRPGMPDHGHTVSRTVLDTMLLQHAEKAGAKVRQGAEVSEPILDEAGRVTGVTLKSGEKIYGDAVIAADGAYSPIKRALHIDSKFNGYSAIAIRSEMDAEVADSDSLDIYLKLAFQGDQLPGYGWVFPMGNGRLNIGLGYVTSYKNWQAINATQFLGEFLRTLPPEWKLPAIEDLKKNKSVRAWRLPMGFTAWPPWRPGVLFTGDSLGAGKPASGRQTAGRAATQSHPPRHRIGSQIEPSHRMAIGQQGLPHTEPLRPKADHATLHLCPLVDPCPDFGAPSALCQTAPCHHGWPQTCLAIPPMLALTAQGVTHGGNTGPGLRAWCR